MEKIDLNNKRILVTGGAGFIGSNLIKRLFGDTKNATIVNLDNLNNYYDVSLKEYRLDMLMQKSEQLHVNYSFIIFVALNVKKKTTVELLNESEKASLYSISFEMDGTTEFEKFVAEFEMNATFNRDYQRIIAALQAILRIGALERFFRPEGSMNDSVQALPIESGKLRLYCLRLSDHHI